MNMQTGAKLQVLNEYLLKHNLTNLIKNGLHHYMLRETDKYKTFNDYLNKRLHDILTSFKNIYKVQHNQLADKSLYCMVTYQLDQNHSNTIKSLEEVVYSDCFNNGWLLYNGLDFNSLINDLKGLAGAILSSQQLMKLLAEDINKDTCNDEAKLYLYNDVQYYKSHISKHISNYKEIQLIISNLISDIQSRYHQNQALMDANVQFHHGIKHNNINSYARLILHMGLTNIDDCKKLYKNEPLDAFQNIYNNVKMLHAYAKLCPKYFNNLFYAGITFDDVLYHVYSKSEASKDILDILKGVYLHHTYSDYRKNDNVSAVADNFSLIKSLLNTLKNMYNASDKTYYISVNTGIYKPISTEYIAKIIHYNDLHIKDALAKLGDKHYLMIDDYKLKLANEKNPSKHNLDETHLPF